MVKTYVRGSFVAQHENEIVEFKGHRQFARENINYARMGENPSRKHISMAACGMLNSRKGGLILIGVLDTGQVQGVTMSPFQQHHFLLNVYDTLGRYTPAVPHSFFAVNFVPLIEPGQKYYEKPSESLLQPMGLDPTFQHVLRSSQFCWCDMAAMAAMEHGLLYPHWIIEIQIAALENSDMTQKLENMAWENENKAFIAEDGVSHIRLSGSNTKIKSRNVVSETKS